jgi:endonuclease YncB( thermonuclease family)
MARWLERERGRMFGWRKKPEDFEWHRYIRTTIKVRRENRRRRVEDAKHAAAEQMHAAGAALAAGSKAAGAAAMDGARAGIGVAGMAAQSAGNSLLAGGVLLLQKLWAAMVVVIDKIGVALRPLTVILERPNVGIPLALVGAIALGSGIGRFRSMGADGETFVAVAIGLVLFAAAWPMLSRMTGVGMPRLPALGGLSPRLAVASLAVVAVAAVAWFVGRGASERASLGWLPSLGSAKPIEGRAQALSGDTLRIGTTTIRLAGIEAPEAEQRCGQGGKQWKCGAAAQQALSRAVSGQRLRCSPEGADSAGLTLASCTAGDTDINSELVRKGHVFAEQSLFARYASQEREARSAKLGLWVGGEAERPSDYRAKVWEEAKRRAPDGCPIKGLVRDGDRVYVLPGASDYERGKVQTSRGGRWFCSEQDAQSAGFKAASRG